MSLLKRLRTNQIIALILFLFSCLYLFQAFQIPQYALPRPVDSDLFPKLLGFSMLVLSVALFFERDKTDEKDEEQASESSRGEAGSGDDTESESTPAEPFWSRPGTQVVVTASAVGLYILLLEVVGFVLTTLVFIFGMTLFYGYRRHLINGIVAATVSFGFYFILTRGLGVYLPPGLLPF
ncbi:tripartite tricarboxylate transporter TctB family protein [Salsuginibacillus kocurii]|uniref:tripartite tricarboxylate transporter TctB family protein n=1 Tax=Salsuginibacillus kocurii TaxID=427078 RepID=UPI00037C0874|nr:tripartite tricarboxylate transporter TctB family protein [Salsuginibacillus kocurii]